MQENTNCTYFSIKNLTKNYKHTSFQSILISLYITYGTPNIQLIKILDAKINHGKNKTLMHNESLYI